MKKKSNSNKEFKTISKYDPQRQQNVLLEDIRKKVEIIAEGHSGLDRKIDKTNEKLEEMDGRLHIISSKLSEHSNKLAEHDRRFDRIEMVVTENTKDMKVLKTDIGQLKTGQERIEQKLDKATTDHEQRIQKLESVR